jgi:hypothetical protein
MRREGSEKTKKQSSSLFLLYLRHFLSVLGLIMSHSKEQVKLNQKVSDNFLKTMSHDIEKLFFGKSMIVLIQFFPL